jgi:phosphatidylglycerophosphatase A
MNSARAARVLASAFGLGHLPWAPGTWATFAALALGYALSALPNTLFFVLSLLLAALAVPLAGRAAAHSARPDPGWIVIDEVVGACVSVSYVDRSDLLTLAFAALFFRLFDIVKPWPVSYLERRFSGGLGIVIDDVAAGLLALACLSALDFIR